MIVLLKVGASLEKISIVAAHHGSIQEFVRVEKRRRERGIHRGAVKESATKEPLGLDLINVCNPG